MSLITLIGPVTWINKSFTTPAAFNEALIKKQH